MALGDDFLPALGDVVVVSRPSDCGTDGETSAPIAADLFAAFLAANTDSSPSLDLAALAPKLRVDTSGLSPRALHFRQRRVVVALSRVGIVGSAALVCVELFATEERGFFLVLAHDGRGAWTLRTELEAWRRDAPEELPDGTPYQP